MSLLRKAQLYWHTLRYLKPVQFLGRVAFLLLRPKPDLHPAPELRLAAAPWITPAVRRPSMLAPFRFRFLESEHEISVGADWNAPLLAKLWLYNLHYFDDLNAERAADRVEWHTSLISRWIAENPPGWGNGWEPYPLSIRIVNWIKWAQAGNALSLVMRHSLAVQVRFLARRMEHHLLGNHLFSNAKALVFSGCFFDGDEAEAWLCSGMAILAREVPEQILPDGGHFERSTMYHALALEDVLDLVNVAQCFSNRLSFAQRRQVADWRRRVIGLYTWLLAMSHPDGEISFFNDAAFDIAVSLAELDAYLHRVCVDVESPDRLPLIHLKDSGYVRLVHGPAVALLDVAPVGPDYLPGHAHADTLSFELSVGVQRVLVNSGTSCYGSGAERQRQRGTTAHNTVVVNGQNSSEVWGGFRVARRAYPLNLRIEQLSDAAATYVCCAHSGYFRLSGKPIHHRTWLMDACGLTVTDWVEGPHQNAEARFHFHPAVTLKAGPGQAEGAVTLPDGSVMTWLIEKGQARLEASTWHPRFGHYESNVCLAVKLMDGKSMLRFNWSPH